MSTRLVAIVVILLAMLSFAGCTSCEDEPPRFRVENGLTVTVDVQIKTVDGKTESINGIEGGTTTSWRSFEPGNVEFAISYEGGDRNDTATGVGVYCYDYTVSLSEGKDVAVSGVPREE